MSNAVFPALPGLEIGVSRSPVWSTTKKPSVNGREYRSANMSYPSYAIKLSFSVLRQTTGFTEFSDLVGFFNARQGSFDSFLWTDPDDNSVIEQAIGVGDGATASFQLIRSFGGFVEPVFDVNSAPLISVSGVLMTVGVDYFVSATGVVTFAVAPGPGPLTWTGTFYRRVRFAKDSAEFSKFLWNLWNLKSLELVSVKP